MEAVDFRVAVGLTIFKVELHSGGTSKALNSKEGVKLKKERVWEEEEFPIV